MLKIIQKFCSHIIQASQIRIWMKPQPFVSNFLTCCAALSKGATAEQTGIITKNEKNYFFNISTVFFIAPLSSRVVHQKHEIFPFYKSKPCNEKTMIFYVQIY